MRVRAIRESLCFTALSTLMLALVGCGGGGVTGSADGTGGYPAPAGPAEVEVSFSGGVASPASASTTVRSAAPSRDSGYVWPGEIREPDRAIEHLFVDVVRVSLMPAEEPFDGEDMDGDVTDVTPADPVPVPDAPRFLTIVSRPPVRVDLLAPEDGGLLARMLDRFDSVPAGTYDKIRIHYRRGTLVFSDNAALNFRPAGRHWFDIRFREGHELVIPPGPAAPLPDGWANLFRVNVEVVGVKIKIVSWGARWWRGCRIIFRPQLVAEVVQPTLSSVIGTVASVARDPGAPSSGVFELSPSAAPSGSGDVRVAFDANTNWHFSDDVLAGSTWVVDVAPEVGAAALGPTAIVEAQGGLDAGGVFRASDVTMTFPDVLAGDADGVGFTGGFGLLYQNSRVAVSPMPDRVTAYYDDATLPAHPVLLYSDITNSSRLLVRGYASPSPPEVPAGIDAWWISWTGSNVAW